MSSALNWAQIARLGTRGEEFLPRVEFTEDNLICFDSDKWLIKYNILFSI